MPSRKRFTKCEICGKRATRENHEKRAFMAKFPLDEDRCRQWVKFVGNEDLIHLPIEKLHLLKHVCADHFENRDFNKIKSRLKKSAIPSKNLKAVPLPDEMLLDFPSHVYSNIGIATNQNPRAICDNEVSLSQVEAIAGPSNSEPRNVDDLEISQSSQPNSSEQASTSNFQHVSNKAPQQATLPLSNTASIGTNKTTATLSLERSLAKLQTEVHSDHPYCKEKSLQSPFDVQPAIKDDSSKIDCDVMETGDPDTDADAFDDELSPSPVPEIAKTHEKVFSWQRTELIEADVPEDPTPVPEKPKLPDDVQTLSLFCDDELPIQSEPSVPAAAVTEDFKPRCKDCSAAIDGFSFWCVQCPRGALCGACAGSAAHRAHYVLRPPRGAAQNQTQAVLAVIRQQLVMENLLTLYETDGDGVKMEVKQEPEEPSPLAAPASPDPLAVAPHPDPLTVGPHPDPLTVGPHPDPLTVEVEPYPDAPIKKCVDEETDHHNYKRFQRIVSPTLIPNSTIKVKYDFQQKILKVPPNVLRGSKTIHTLSPGDLRSTDIIQATTSDFRGSQQKHDPSVLKSQRVHILTPSHLRSRGVKLVPSGKTRKSQVLITAASNLRSRSLNVPIRSQTVRTLTTGDLKSGVIQATTSNSRVSQDVRNRPIREPSEVMLRTVTSEAAVQLQPLTSSDIRKWSADRKRRKID
ncbi:uncharacterized protein LOC133530717 isoform X3 [Cydia pomonella]|uniref:uncharacterized protein LOC133530717 isoform X3 n=1 Tax=Cydia pomonella TaxID=82600 RepID=UPI002ADE84A7|nr:uncharacterized protein LOC133530717 isoform X3 [Cydia pomonella]